MITKVAHSASLSKTLGYVYQGWKHAEVVGGSGIAQKYDDVYGHLKASIDTRPDISKPVFHAILSVPQEEKLTPAQWGEISSDYMDKMGYGRCAYVVVEHNDTAHNHVHIVASRIDDQKQRVKDNWNWRRSENAARELELKHGLKPVMSSWKVEKKCAQSPEYHRDLRMSQRSPRELMHSDVANALKASSSENMFARALETEGISAQKKVDVDGKVLGWSFEKGGVKYGGSSLDQGFSAEKIEREFSRNAQKIRPAHLDIGPDGSTSSGEKFRSVGRAATSGAQATRPENLGALHTKASASSLKVEPDDRALSAQLYVRDALAKAPRDKGWSGWSSSLREKGIEPVPKVTQEDKSKIVGMYLVHQKTPYPASKIDRGSSYGALSRSMGTYEEAKDTGAFRWRKVPGADALEAWPAPMKMTPHAPTNAASLAQTSALAHGGRKPMDARNESRSVEANAALKHFANPGPALDAKRGDELMNLAQLQASMRAQGQEWTVPRERLPERATLMERDVETKQGRYMLAVDKDHKVTLIRHNDSLEALRGKDVHFGKSPQGKLTIEPAGPRQPRPSMGDDVKDREHLAKVELKHLTNTSLKDWSKQSEGMEVLGPQKVVHGKLLSQDVQLKEGRFSMVERRDKGLTMVPYSTSLEAHRDRAVSVAHKADGVLKVKSLEHGMNTQPKMKQ